MAAEDFLDGLWTIGGAQAAKGAFTSSSTFTFTGVLRHDHMYAYKDMGAGWITGDFSESATYTQTDSVAERLDFIIGVADAIGDYSDIYNNLNNGLTVYVNASTGKLYINENATGVSSNSAASTISIAVGTPYYITLDRVGTTATCRVYSDPTFQVLLDTITKTVAAPTYRYAYTYQNYGFGTGVTPYSGTIETLTLGGAGLVIQKPLSSGIANNSVSVGGIYTLSVTSVECQVIDAATLAVVVAWTTVDAAPTGGVWSGTMTVPDGGDYTMQARDSAVPGTVYNGPDFAVGLVIVLAGQSQPEELLVYDGTAETPTNPPAALSTSLARVYDITSAPAWAAPAGNGVIAFVNKLYAALSKPIGIVSGARGGSPLTLAATKEYGAAPQELGCWELATNPAVPYDFTTFTTVGTDVSVTTDRRINATSLPTNVDEYVYKDMGVGHFTGTYTISQNFWIDPASSSASQFSPLMLSNALDDFYGHTVTATPMIGIRCNVSAGGLLNIFAWEQDGPTSNYVFWSGNTGVWYFTDFRVDSTVGVAGTVYLDIYDDANKITPLTTLTLTLNTARSFQYYYALSSLNYGGIPVIPALEVNQTPISFYANLKDALTGLSLSADYIWWGQGEEDATWGISAATYSPVLSTLFDRFRADYGAAIPILVNTLGRATVAAKPTAGGEDASWSDIRQAIRDIATTDATAIVAFDAIDMVLGDGVVHWDGAGYEAAGNRLAQAILNNIDPVTYPESIGPELIPYIPAGPTTLNVNIRHIEGTDFTPLTAIGGFEVFNGAAWVAPSAAVQLDATTIQLTHSGATAVRYLYGQNPSITSIVYDNKTLPVPLSPSNLAERLPVANSLSRGISRGLR